LKNVFSTCKTTNNSSLPVSNFLKTETAAESSLILVQKAERSDVENLQKEVERLKDLVEGFEGEEDDSEGKQEIIFR
jgi:hypothetical protein